MGDGAVDHRPDVRFGVAFTVLTVASLGGAGGWIWAVQDRLPDPIARHWSGGQADGFSELPAIIAMTVGLPLLVAAPFAVIAVLGRSPLPLRRCMGATAMFLVLFMAALGVDSLRGQLDLADAASAPAPNVGLAVGAVLGLLGVGLAIWTVRDRPERAAARLAGAPPPSDAPRLEPLPPLPWTAAPTGVDVAATVAFGLALLVVVGLVPLAGWGLLVLVPFLVVVGLLFGRYNVVVDEHGIEARSRGRRLLRVALDEVAVADAVEVDPFWEFGGWGLRVDVAGRVGLVTRRGPAVRIRRGDDSEVLVGVDDAETTAALLNTLADRQRRAAAAGD